ncbi:tRNA (adenosine(37)-N6)-dimethylallyltransferase MiaA [Paraflavitalea pollutisoli]|uniref:tRNA (adenosine(37)-N6)-dimethylallyltransferase MiaA n=1 Tax=Paraflavitalea pollutisoli TaxID=3034143 RepID=UPI0023EC2194|nr:tRNA (adenosine(37)-N6)-dimethylallyltransferase MiaA [Paraflavitalea sp. H1-2-19X]
MQPVCIVIVGPTAVGKTALAIRVAQQFGTSIISADSRQCFREMTIGVAKPSPEELAAVPHYFINSHSIHEDVNAAVFEQYALQAVKKITSTHPVVVMTGGTGLYVKAFCEGLDDIPAVLPTVREEIAQQYELDGISWLQQQVAAEDPLYYSTGEIHNPQRLIRALEVKRSTGQSIRHFQQGKKAARDFRIVKIGLELPRPELYRNINQRVENMVQAGQVEEARSLLPWRSLNALQTVGYNELFDYFEGAGTLATAVEAIKTNTRHYAKRQLTWFRKDPAIQWFSPENAVDVLQYAQASTQEGN